MSIHSNSKRAYAQTKAIRLSRAEKIVKLLAKVGEPLTDKQIAVRMGFPHGNYVQPRITELVRSGQLFEHPSVQCDVSGIHVRRTSVLPYTQVDADRDFAEVVMADAPCVDCGSCACTKDTPRINKIGDRFVALKDGSIAGALVKAGEVFIIAGWTTAFSGNWEVDCITSGHVRILWNDEELADASLALVVERKAEKGDRIAIIKTGYTDNSANVVAGQVFKVDGAGEPGVSYTGKPFTYVNTPEWVFRAYQQGEWFLNIGPAK
jgi:hypothetical protein